METVSTLAERIDAEFSASQGRWDELRTKHVQAFQARRQKLERFERTADELREIWEPRLDALAKKFGKNMDARPTVTPGSRALAIEIESNLARITLRFGVAPDADVQNLVFSYDVEILPVLMDFNSHDELELRLDAVNKLRLAEWLDNRVIDFVHTYLALYDNQYYLQDHMFEDPIAKVKFPKFAAAATLEQNGQVFHFIDEATLREFQECSNDRQV